MPKPKKLKTFCEELVWDGDLNRGNYFAVVLAPDDETAERMIAAQMLEDASESLSSRFAHEDEPGTLKDYYNEHSYVASWGDLKGSACPNCTSHDGHPNGDHIEVDGAQREKHVCRSCGYAWLPLGFDELTRIQIEDGARKTIEALDDIERESMEGDDDDD